MALVAAPASWTHSLPYHHAAHTPLRPQSATWNTKFPSMPSSYSSSSGAKPRLRLAVQVVVPAVEEKRPAPPPLRFDPFSDEPPVASTSQLPPATQNTPPPASARGRSLTPLSIAVPTSTPTPAPATPPPTGRRRAPSFSAGSGAALPRSLGGLSSLTRAAQLYPHNLHPASSHSGASPSAKSASHPVYNSYSLCSAPSPAPSLARSRSPQPPPPPPAQTHTDAPSAFHARHYPTPDARARLLARTLLTRIHAVGRPRGASAALYSCSKGSSLSRKNGYESECGGRGYVPSRLRECTVAC